MQSFPECQVLTFPERVVKTHLLLGKQGVTRIMVTPALAFQWELLRLLPTFKSLNLLLFHSASIHLLSAYCVLCAGCKDE